MTRRRGAGRKTVRLRAVKRGRVHVRITATDAAGNRFATRALRRVRQFSGIWSLQIA